MPIFVQMKTHNSEVYALYNKKYSSFALYDGKHGSNFTPYQVSSKFRGREQDKKFIAGLRHWLSDNQLDTGIFRNTQVPQSKFSFIRFYGSF